MAVVLSTDVDFEKHLTENTKVAVKYFADWCGTCRLFAPKYKRLSNDQKYNNIIFLEVDAEKNPGARKAAGVDNLPFFAVFADGALVGGSATSKEDKVVEMLDMINN